MNLLKKPTIAIEDEMPEQIEPESAPVVCFDTEQCAVCLVASAHAMLKTSPPLYFCMHHRVALNDALMDSSFDVIDDQMVIKQMTENGNRWTSKN